MVIISSVSAFADPAPQFAFSIGSNQIPGGIWPTAVGADSEGKVYIASLWNMFKVDANGSLLSGWGTQGTGPGQFSYAGPMAFDSSGHIFILDSYNDRVEEFDTNGTFMTAWGSYGTRPGQFDQPDGLAVSRSGRIYVSDSINFRIQVFSSPGVFLKQFGTIGTNAGQFSFPGVIAVDSSNDVYVVDVPGGSFDTYRIQKFDADGNFLTEWGSYGANTNTAIEIAGITTDAENNVYVADGGNNRIQKYTGGGTFLSEWGSGGTGPGEFNTPMGIGMDPTGNYVYVSDYYNARINVFAYAGMGPLIYQPPTNQTVPAGATLTLDAGVFGAQPIAYRWEFNGTTLTAATAPSLMISNVQLTDSGTYSVSATNSLGTAASPSATVSVLPVVVNTLPVSGISATGAVLNGSVWLGSNPSTSWFEWGTNANYGETAGLTNLGPNVAFALSRNLSDLSGEVTYHYRLVGSNTLGVAFGQDATFEIGLKPSVQSLPVSPTDSGGVFLNALVNPEARDTSVFFRWGRYNPYQYNTPANQLQSAATPTMIQSPVTGLVAGAIYSFQPVASNELGSVSGAIVSFIAPPWVLLPVPAGNVWSALATSADGSRLAAASQWGRIYVSSDSGVTWASNTVASESWQSLTMSAGGTRLMAGQDGSLTGLAYFSTNSGKSWNKSNGPARHWHSLAASGDGLRVAAADPIGQLVLTSTDGGLDWKTNSPPVSAMWSTIASSADGQRLIVGAGGMDRTTNGPVYTSTDAGLSWTSNSLPVSYWRSVASSADGKVLLAAVGGLHAGPIYISTNAGFSWALTGAAFTNWQTIAVSADASKLAAVVRVESHPVFTSTNLGVSWDSYVLPQAQWSDVALSADGARVFASADQSIVTLHTTPAPRLELSFGNGNSLFSWIIPSTPVVLQQSSDLSNQQWTDLSIAPAAVLSNLRYQVTLPAANRSSFYRLKAAQ